MNDELLPPILIRWRRGVLAVSPPATRPTFSARRYGMKLTNFGFAMVIGLAAPSAVFAGGDKGGAEWKMMDTNGDGKISAEEHAAGAKKMFEMMDANHDGKVTAAEMDAAHEKITGRKAAAG